MPERPTTPSARHVDLSQVETLTATRLLSPSYATFADAPWLQALLDERMRFAGQPRRFWRNRLSEPLAVPAPQAKLRVAVHVLDRLVKDRVNHALAPRQVRSIVFRAAARLADREEALACAAAELGVPTTAILEGMFADLPDERTLVPLEGPLDAMQLALLCNEAIVAGLLHHALRVRIWARGQVRAVVRHAKWTGLLCVMRPGPGEATLKLEVSGPYSLFRHTRLYGRALASLVPRLARCDAYRLEADCVLPREQEVRRLVLRSGDPIAPARELPRFDSRVEERFARDFRKLALDWEVVREPQPMAAGQTLFFPDFQLRRRNTGECYWLEIVGYWTPAYLAKKLDQLKQARLERLILCVDESRQCGDGELEQLGQVVRYKRTVDARAVIAIIDPALSASLAATPSQTSARRARKTRRAAP